MPVIKSAKKRMRQNVKRRARNFPVRSELKTMFKKGLTLIKNGEAEEAKKIMPKIYSIIDMACKKNILHPNNASRKKSRLARELNILESKEDKKSAPEKAAKPAKAVKKEEKVEKEEKSEA